MELVFCLKFLFINYAIFTFAATSYIFYLYYSLIFLITLNISNRSDTLLKTTLPPNKRFILFLPFGKRLPDIFKMIHRLLLNDKDNDAKEYLRLPHDILQPNQNLYVILVQAKLRCLLRAIVKADHNLLVSKGAARGKTAPSISTLMCPPTLVQSISRQSRSLPPSPELTRECTCLCVRRRLVSAARLSTPMWESVVMGNIAPSPTPQVCQPHGYCYPV